MLHDDYLYLCHHRKDIKTDEEFRDLILNAFPDIIGADNRRFYFPLVMSILAHVCNMITPASMAAVFGSYANNASARVRLSQMKERGAFEILPFRKYDMGSRIAYRLATDATENLLCLLPDFMKSKAQPNRQQGYLSAHSYATGLSLLQCILLGEPFRYAKEGEVLSQNWTEETVYVDATVCFEDKEQTVLYIEEDRGTESTTVLLKKIATYESLGLLNSSNHHLVISSHAIYNNDCISFNLSTLSAIERLMVENGYRQVYRFYVEQENLLSKKKRDCLRAYLVRTGLCEYHSSKGKKIPAHKLSSNVPLNRVLDLADHTLEDLQEYIRTLKDGTNRYRLIDYNKLQAKATFAKLKNIGEAIARQIYAGRSMTPGINCFLHGANCYVLPTTLLSNYINPLRGRDLRKILDSIQPYFDSLIDEDPLSVEISFPSFPALTLPTCFRKEGGGIVCIERPDINIGGFVRTYFLNLLRENGLVDDIHIVCICDTEAHAMYLAKLMSYYQKDRFLPEEGISISFLLSADIGEKHKLSVSCDLGNGGLLYLNPKDNTK